MIEDAIPHSRLPGGVGVLRDEASPPRMKGVEIVDDDGRFGDRAVARLVAEHGKFASGQTAEKASRDPRP